MTNYASYYTSSLGPISVARVLICKQCHKYIACMDNLLSRAYCGAQSPTAGLFEDVSNISLGPRQMWLMRSGAHTIREMACLGCGQYVGFQIVHAHEPSERWKNGAYILERKFLYIHSVYECAPEEDGADGMSYKWPGTPLRLKVVEDLRTERKAKRMTVLSSPPQTRGPSTPTFKPLPAVPRSIEAC